MSHDSIRSALAAALADLGVERAEIQLERPRDPDHGDIATNVAMTLARELRKAPRQIADEIVDRLDLGAAGVDAVEVAGPGFLNFRLSSGRSRPSSTRSSEPTRRTAEATPEASGRS